MRYFELLYIATSHFGLPNLIRLLYTDFVHRYIRHYFVLFSQNRVAFLYLMSETIGSFNLLFARLHFIICQIFTALGCIPDNFRKYYEKSSMKKLK